MTSGRAGVGKRDTRDGTVGVEDGDVDITFDATDDDALETVNGPATRESGGAADGPLARVAGQSATGDASAEES